MKLPACDSCKRPVSIDQGALAISSSAALASAERLMLAKEEHLPRPGDSDLFFTAAQVARLPSPLPWLWGHAECLDACDYHIAATRVDSPLKALAWTFHLAEKYWFSMPSWKSAMTRLHDLESVANC